MISNLEKRLQEGENKKGEEHSHCSLTLRYHIYNFWLLISIQLCLSFLCPCQTLFTVCESGQRCFL